jgi:hypothetical protein
MPRIHIVIDTDNAAFEDDYEGEMEKILEDVSVLVIDEQTEGILHDSNGNAVGEVTIKEAYEEGEGEDEDEDEE